MKASTTLSDVRATFFIMHVQMTCTTQRTKQSAAFSSANILLQLGQMENRANGCSFQIKSQDLSTSSAFCVIRRKKCFCLKMYDCRTTILAAYIVILPLYSMYSAVQISWVIPNFVKLASKLYSTGSKICICVVCKSLFTLTFYKTSQHFTEFGLKKKLLLFGSNYNRNIGCCELLRRTVEDRFVGKTKLHKN